MLEQIQSLINQAQPLIETNHLEVLIRDVTPGEDLAVLIGGYGRFISPPHYLVPVISGQSHLLEDWGYRVEDVVIRLTELGLGSCYVGAFPKEPSVLARFGFNAPARIGALVAFGRPARSLGGRTVNSLIRSGVGATRKLPAERIFFQDSFENPTQPPNDIEFLIEAVRQAPSAVNAQPWRFLWHQKKLYLFVTRNNRRYGGTVTQQYRLVDGGICMRHVTLALEAFGKSGHWFPYSANSIQFPNHPADLEPLAVLELDDTE